MGDRDDHSPSSAPVSSRRTVVLKGIAGSPGVATGPVLVVDTKRIGVAHRHVSTSRVDDEFERFQDAVRVAAAGLRDVAKRVSKKQSSAETSILGAYLLMVEDESMHEDVERHIRVDHLCAEWALECAVNEIAEQLQAAGDPYLAERSHDVEFIGDRIQMSFGGKQRDSQLPVFDEPCILVARDLSPAETATLRKDKVLAFVTEVGTRTTHTAILARALEIPAVVGAPGALATIGNDDIVTVDGSRGEVTVSPTKEMIAAAEARAERHAATARGLHQRRDQPARTKCGVPVSLRANIELPDEADIALDEGAQGIGLYRTEFLYVNRTQPPSEDEQYKVYRRVLELAGKLPVTLRTFDIGGDKYASAFKVPEGMNPALGLRAVRLGLSRPDIFMPQLRAMVRASAHGTLRVMIPMVAAVPELLAVRKLLDRAIREVDAAGHERAAEIPLGIMVEVPSAALMANEFAEYAEFFSIGTNDLIQYSLAVDRTSSELAYLASPFDPSILRLIRQVVEAGAAHDRPVTVCGAMASDPLAAVVLIGLGLRELSLEASALAEVKEALSRVTVEEARDTATAVSKVASAEQVEQIVAATYALRFRDLLDRED